MSYLKYTSNQLQTRNTHGACTGLLITYWRDTSFLRFFTPDSSISTRVQPLKYVMSGTVTFSYCKDCWLHVYVAYLHENNIHKNIDLWFFFPHISINCNGLKIWLFSYEACLNEWICSYGRRKKNGEEWKIMTANNGEYLPHVMLRATVSLWAHTLAPHTILLAVKWKTQIFMRVNAGARSRGIVSLYVCLCMSVFVWVRANISSMLILHICGPHRTS